MTISIGWPVPFFEFDILNMNTIPIRWVVMILSLLGYLVLSYIVDVALTYALIAFKGPEKPETVMTQARKAYFYYKGQGLDETKISELFKQKGWKDEDIEKLK